MKALLSIFILLLTARAFALPVIAMDLDFLQKASVVKKRSPKEIEAYNKWISDPKNNPSFAREVILDFGVRQVRVYLIGSTHASPKDNEFIRGAIHAFQIDPAKSNLFIEQGDSFSDGGGANQLLARIQRDVPELSTAVARARRSKTSILNPEFSRNLVFGVAAREWNARGGPFTNFDAASNYSDEALAFLAQNLEPNVALRFLRTNLHGETFTIDEFKTLANKTFSFTKKDVEAYTDCCGNLRELVRWIVDDNQLRNLVRERFMKQILFTRARDGDVIVTHPAHLTNILSRETSPADPLANPR